MGAEIRQSAVLNQRMVKKSDSSISPMVGVWNSCAPFPLTPTLSPRRGRTFACPHQIAAALTWCLAAWLPLLGERVGVRGNLIDARTESQKCNLQHEKDPSLAGSAAVRLP